MKQRTIKRMLAMGAALLPAFVMALLLGVASPARAAGTVGSGPGTCDDAGLSTAMAGGGLVTFNCGAGPVVIPITLKTLTSGSTTIDGGGGLITLDGGGTHQLFVVTGTATLVLKNLTLAHGYTNGGLGGAIYNSGVLTLTNSSVVSSQAVGNAGGGGIFNDHGSVALVSSTLASNVGGSSTGSGIGGGALYNNGGSATLTNATLMSNTSSYDGGGVLNRGGALTITGSSLVGNLAWYGGGIENQTAGATLVLVDTTLRANQAYTTYFGGTGNGGALDNFNGAAATLNNVTLSSNHAEDGGGLENDTSFLTVTNSTLSTNTAGYAGGGFDSAYGISTLTNVTLSGNGAVNSGGGLDNYHARTTLTFVTLSGNSAANGGGLYQIGTSAGQAITLTDTLVAHGASGVDCVSVSSTFSITSNNYNLSDDTSCNSYFIKANDQKNVNPLLGPLADNGGPTLTHLPAAGSPAVDHGGLICPATDQRGVARPQGPACDIGSVERAGTGFVPTSWLYLPLVRR